MNQTSSGAVRPVASPQLSLGERLAQAVSRWSGSTAAFSIALISVAIWGATGPLFHWSDTWQLVMNTVSSIVTFLMVFLIQRSQNKDALAIHLKLNEIVAAMEGASNHIVSVEDLSEAELQRLKERYQQLVEAILAGQASRASVQVDRGPEAPSLQT
jgi:low affinity Fe/Cu permease